MRNVGTQAPQLRGVSLRNDGLEGRHAPTITARVMARFDNLLFVVQCEGWRHEGLAWLHAEHDAHLWEPIGPEGPQGLGPDGAMTAEVFNRLQFGVMMLLSQGRSYWDPPALLVDWPPVLTRVVGAGTGMPPHKPPPSLHRSASKPSPQRCPRMFPPAGHTPLSSLCALTCSHSQRTTGAMGFPSPRSHRSPRALATEAPHDVEEAYAASYRAEARSSAQRHELVPGSLPADGSATREASAATSPAAAQRRAAAATARDHRQLWVYRHLDPNIGTSCVEMELEDCESWRISQEPPRSFR
eukprot:SAG11_NODE_858_length_6850_cov_11.886535_9_plen_299_part_00